MARVAFLAGLLLAAAGAASAQDTTPPAPAAPAIDPTAGITDRVVARGRRMSEIGTPELEDYVSDFVGQIAAPPRGAGYARWQRRVCVGVYNLATEPAQYIVDRVSALALEVGLDPGDPGCTPDVRVFFSLNGQEMASYMVENERHLFRPAGGEGGVQLGLEALDNFANSDRAVRWWHVSMPTDPRTGARAIRLPTDIAPPALTDGGGGGSRLYRQLRDDMLYAIIIVDATKLTEVTWEELGDYIAFVSLAQIDPEANPESFDSILNLFTNPTAYSGLTDWDRNYVGALYSFDQQRNPRVQTVELINAMARREERAAAE